MDKKKIELAAKEAMRRVQMTTGREDLYRDVAAAIAAAIEEYDRQTTKPKD